MKPSANFLGQRAKSRLLRQWAAERAEDPATWRVGARGWNARSVQSTHYITAYKDDFRISGTVVTLKWKCFSKPLNVEIY